MPWDGRTGTPRMASNLYDHVFTDNTLYCVGFLGVPQRAGVKYLLCMVKNTEPLSAHSVKTYKDKRKQKLAC